MRVPYLVLAVVGGPDDDQAMTEKKVWLITGAGRGLGVHIARAALSTGHAIAATGRDAAKVAVAVGEHDNLLAITLDVTRPQDAEAAVEAAVAKFGRIEILSELRRSSRPGRVWMGSRAGTPPSSLKRL